MVLLKTYNNTLYIWNMDHLQKLINNHKPSLLHIDCLKRMMKLIETLDFHKYRFIGNNVDRKNDGVKEMDLIELATCLQILFLCLAANRVKNANIEQRPNNIIVFNYVMNDSVVGTLIIKPLRGMR